MHLLSLSYRVEAGTYWADALEISIIVGLCPEVLDFNLVAFVFVLPSVVLVVV